MKSLFTFFSVRKVILFVLIFFTLTAKSQIPASVLSWKFPSGAIYSGPLVVDQTVYIGDLKGKFSALDLATGQEKWSYQAADYIASCPAFKNNIIIFEAGDRLHGLNAQTGELLWTFKSTDKVPTPGGVTGYHHSSPVIEGNTAYYGDEWGNMNGVNILNGNLDFQYHVPFTYTTPSDYNIRSTPVIKDSIIYFGDYEANIYAISLKNKTEKWIKKIETPRWEGSVVSEMVIDDNVLYFGRYTNALIPLDLETGEQLWKFSDLNTFLPSTPVFYKDNVIMGTTIDSNHIYALKKATGEKSWEIKVKGIFFNKPIIIEDSILVMNSTDPFSDQCGVLYFIDLNRGKIINEIHLPNATESYPVKSGNLILIGKNDGLYAFEYKPLLGKPSASCFIFDNSTENYTLKRSETFRTSFPLINEGLFCDSVTITYEREGDATKARIALVDRINYPIHQYQQLDITFVVKANSLKVGDYTVKIHINSARQTGEYLYEKTVKLSVTDPTGTDDLQATDNACSVFPNPFSETACFRLNLFAGSKISMVIRSVTGEVVYSKTFQEPTETITWNGRNNKNLPVPSGVYVYLVSSEKNTIAGKLIKK